MFADVYEGNAVIENLLWAEELLLLKRDGIDTSLLEAEINKAPDPSLYTYYSYEAYEKALSAAINILYDENSTQKAINDAYSMLNAKYAALKTRAAKENVALGKDVTSSGLEAATVDITKAVDGVDTTNFASRVNINNADDAWLCVDLGAVYMIDGFSLHWYTQPSKYAIMISTDGDTWTAVYTDLACKKMNKQAVDVISIEATEARYVKFQQIQMLIGNAEKNYRYTGNITELKVFASDMTVDTSALQSRYESVSSLDASSMHPDCLAEHKAALLEAERVLALTSPTQAEVDAAAELLVAHSAFEWVDNGNEKVFVCACGSEYREALKKITLNGARLNVDENINMIYIFTVNEEVSDLRIAFEFRGKLYEISEYELLEDGRYAFRFNGIMPQQMTDKLTATVYAKDAEGVEFSINCGGISVKDYVKSVLELYPEETELVTLVSDLLVYGAAAQAYVGYNTDNLATDGVDVKPSEQFVRPSSKLQVVENSSACSFNSVGLNLSGEVNMYFTFKTQNTDGLVLKISINGRESVYNVSELTPTSEGIYRVDFNSIMAHELDDTVTAQFYLNGEAIGNYATYSVNSYVNAMVTDNESALNVLLKSLSNYGASAKAYKY